ncbi:hypothetical protein GS399_11080 [Pedobacter sp. HMF7647]|uniref:Uncharacterized protein n=1 Tax=Hufsiella arboris TaxID=2695275 RepID=A0A7K1YAB9_9SPHI|nr:hypothetical protein [Hufsiella arboris]MXV51514.1 hypothetical protein [Hufsiella arboris]
MTRVFLFVIFLIPFLSGCKKDQPTDPEKPKVVAGITIQSISSNPFLNSDWQHAIGGKGVLEFKLKDSKDSTSSRTQDSLDLANASLYKKELTVGKYDIILDTKKTSNVADTFLRFHSELKGLSVEKQEAVSLSVTSSDGLITIDKDYIKDKTTPTFQSKSDSKAYNLGLINGFYYIYVKGDISGTISFTSQITNKVCMKDIDVKSSNHYNLVVSVSKNNSVQIFLGDFHYKNVAGDKSTLLTLDIDPGYMSFYKNVYYILADENGEVLNKFEYQKGSAQVSVISNKDFQKDRFNLYRITIPLDNGAPDIIGYLGIKKGSVWRLKSNNSPMRPNVDQAKMTIKPGSEHYWLRYTADNSWSEIHPFDPTVLNTQTLVYSADSKLFLLAKSNKGVFYNFFDLPAGTKTFTFDPDKCTREPVVKTFTSPGSDIQATVFAWPYKDFGNLFWFGSDALAGNTLNYYLPQEVFGKYLTNISYKLNDKNYSYTYVGSEIPLKPEMFDADFEISGSNLGDFKFSFNNKADYYIAVFFSDKAQFRFYSPVAANYTKLKFPDFSEYLKTDKVDYSTFKLHEFSLHSGNIFKEDLLDYPVPGNPANVETFGISKYFN